MLGKTPQMYLAVCIICSVADYGTHFQARIGVPGCGTWSGCSQDAQSWLLQGRNLIFFQKRCVSAILTDRTAARDC